MNLRCDDKFVQDKCRYAACERYDKFVHKHKDSRVPLLELGVGSNTPGTIKYPFRRLAKENPKATYACINLGEAMCPPQIENRAICINADIGEVLTDMIE